jgi:hypothetical protein
MPSFSLVIFAVTFIFCFNENRPYRTIAIVTLSFMISEVQEKVSTYYVFDWLDMLAIFFAGLLSCGIVKLMIGPQE